MTKEEVQSSALGVADSMEFKQILKLSKAATGGAAVRNIRYIIDLFIWYEGGPMSPLCLDSGTIKVRRQQ